MTYKEAFEKFQDDVRVLSLDAQCSLFNLDCEWYPMSEFDDIVTGTPMDIVRLVEGNTEFCSNDNFFWYDGIDIKSSDHPDVLEDVDDSYWEETFLAPYTWKQYLKTYDYDVDELEQSKEQIYTYIMKVMENDKTFNTTVEWEEKLTDMLFRNVVTDERNDLTESVLSDIITEIFDELDEE